MFTDLAINNYCIIGTPALINDRNNNALSNNDDQSSSLYKSKIGGFAIWHDIKTAPKPNDIKCLVCGLVDHIVLVTQLYAPIECYHRSLYVFCCNTRSCSLQSKSWIVIRNQIAIRNINTNKQENIGHNNNKEINVKNKIIQETNQNLNKRTITNKLPQDKIKDTIVSSSVWDDLILGIILVNEKDSNEISDATASTDLELTRLIIERDLALDNKMISNTNSILKNNNIIHKSKVVSTNTNSNNNNNKNKNSMDNNNIESEIVITNHHIYPTIEKLEYFDIYDIDEIWTESDEIAAKEGEYVQVEVHSSHIENLLESYFEGEENLEILDIVSNSYKKYNINHKQQYHYDVNTTIEKKVTFSINNNNISDNTIIKNINKNKNYSKNKNKNKDNNKDNNGDDNDDDNETKECNLSRSSIKQQIESYFNNRVSFYPHQVIRYAYDGIPLWITHPYPIQSNNHNNNNINNNNKNYNSRLLKDNNKNKSTNNKHGSHTTTYNNNNSNNNSNNNTSNNNDTSTSFIPYCESCGTQRVFEFQIMPALLSVINQTNITNNCQSITKTNSTNHMLNINGNKLLNIKKDLNNNIIHTNNNPINNSKTSNDSHSVNDSNKVICDAIVSPTIEDIHRFQDTLGKGLDFGVVTIWSCPNSCELKKYCHSTTTAINNNTNNNTTTLNLNYLQEVAIIQGPPDIM